eukprot:1997119-Prymnesium_polylepis.1
MVRYAPLVSQRPKPSRVIGRMRAASALSATTECLPATAEMLPRAFGSASGRATETCSTKPYRLISPPL